MKSLITKAQEKKNTTVAQCCAKNSKVISGCHD